MKTLMLDVDTQVDFCVPTGALFVGGADRLLGNFVRLTQVAEHAGALIIGSVDSHSFDAWEFAGSPNRGPNGEQPNFPPHCVKGTHGWLKVDGTTTTRARFVPNVPLAEADLAALANRHAPTQLLLEKEVYSLFANPNAKALLNIVTAGEPTRFIVYGVALDYCVRAAALGAVEWLTKQSRSGEVWLVEDSTAAVAKAGGDAALGELAVAGVKNVLAQDVVMQLSSR